MKHPKPESWKERDFEKWFLAHPVLPDGERLAVVSQQVALRRVADLVALDAEAGLVIMEIKNETALRSAVGQALEYLSQYDEVTIEALSDDLRVDEMPIERMFENTFGKKLDRIQSARRVIIVAPQFDYHSGHGISFLNRKFEGPGIRFQLLQAKRHGDGFAMEFVEPPSLRHSSQLVGKFGLTPGQRLVFVLEGGSPQILWVLGTKRNGVLQLFKGPAVTRRALRPGMQLLLPDSAEDTVDLGLQDTTWRHKTRPQETAKVTGVVQATREKVIFFAQCKNGQWGFRQRPLHKFMSDWQREEQSHPSWREIVREVTAQKSICGA